MESMDLSFEALTRETLELSNYLSQRGWDNEVASAHQIDLSNHLLNQFAIDQVPRYPQSSGVVFRIDRGAGTFCLRGVACKNIEETFSALDRHDEVLYKKLKIDGDVDDVRYFESGSLERAEMIRDQLFNRRFPIEEDRICNISDPGFSWWMERKDCSIQIYYQSISVDRATTLTKLGPIGDGKIASRFFMYLESVLSDLMPMVHFSSEPRSFKLVCETAHPLFNELIELFQTGRDIFTNPQFDAIKMVPTLYFYLSELATLRQFWISVEDDVGGRGPMWLQ